MTDKAFWTGELCFGIVNIPFSLHVSHQSHDYVFKTYIDGDPVGMGKKINKRTSEEIKDPSQIQRGIDMGEGIGTVFLDKQEIEALNPKPNHLINIESFFELGNFDFTRFDTHYTMVPESNNETDIKAYDLLDQVLESEYKGAFVRIKLRHREQLCLIHHSNGGLVLSTLFYQDEIVKRPSMASVEPTPSEVFAAKSLVGAMTVDDSYYSKIEDPYHNALTELIFSKING